MGQIKLLPGSKENNIVAIAGSNSINIINVGNEFIEPFICVENTAAFGQ